MTILGIFPPEVNNIIFEWSEIRGEIETNLGNESWGGERLK